MNGPVTIALTGASGYVGSVLARALRKNGRILVLGRKPNGPDQIPWRFASDPVELATALRTQGVTHLIHAAWDMQASSLAELRATCVAGSANLLSASQEAGVRRVIFISTISAFEGARSAYGRSKLEVEQLYLNAGATVLRLGLVYGDGTGGMFGKLRETISRSKFVPMIGSGATPQYPLHERVLAEVVERAVAGEFDGEARPIAVAQYEPVAFRDMLRQVAAKQHRSIVLVPLPWPLLYAALRTAEAIGLKLGFRSDSVLGFVYQNPKPDFAILRSHGVDPVRFPATASKRI